jgi:hypothetical protein
MYPSEMSNLKELLDKSYSIWVSTWGSGENASGKLLYLVQWLIVVDVFGI